MITNNSNEAEKQFSFKNNRWKVTFLRKKFKYDNIEDLYSKYRIRHQRHMLLQIIIIIMIFSVLWLIIFNSIDLTKSLAEKIWANILISLAIILGGFTAHLLRLKNNSALITLFFNIILFLFVHVFQPNMFSSIEPISVTPISFYSIFVLTALSPVNYKWTLIWSCLLSLINLFIFTVYGESSLKIGFILALIEICAMILGYYFKYLIDILHRHTFLDAKNFIETEYGKINEREKQIEMKETLLLKIIPGYLLSDMKAAMNEQLVNVTITNQQIFNDLLVHRHENVSILFADIVSFTKLAMLMEPPQLIKALNQLFGQFDLLAEKNNCFRIKILGDCYYCVCGIPDEIPTHAKNSVIMGLQMILVIRTIREETGIENLNMRIGINSGFVLSGVLGLRKWQYDIWSDDVSIANHLESTGRPGKIHISNSTRELLNDEFKTYKTRAMQRNSYLRGQGIETYFIDDSELIKIEETWDTYFSGFSLSDNAIRRSRRKAKRWKKNMTEVLEFGATNPFESLPEYLTSRTKPAKEEIQARLSKAFCIDDDDKSKSSLTSYAEKMCLISLNFRCPLTENAFRNKKDHLYTLSLLAVIVIIIFILVLQLIETELHNVAVVVTMIGLFLFLFFWIVSLDLITDKTHPFIWKICGTYIYKCIDHKWTRTLMLVVAIIIITTSSLLPLVLFKIFQYEELNNLDTNETFTTSTINPSNLSTDATYDFKSDMTNYLSMTNLTLQRNNGSISENMSYEALLTEIEATRSSDISSDDVDLNECCNISFQITCCMLTLVACSSFIHIPYLNKTAVNIICILIYHIVWYTVFHDAYVLGFLEERLTARVQGTLFILMLFITLVSFDRQMDKEIRLDYLCSSIIAQDYDSSLKTEMLNEMLIVNMLPRHVSCYFLNPRRKSNNIYSEECKNVCVAFAAIPSFKIFFSTIDVAGKECLRMLNEIISSFDEMTTGLTRIFDGVEKIKTIGSTYMVVSGLNDEEELDPAKPVLKMLKFCLGMMKQLSDLNKDAFSDYLLRIGMAHGSVIAGVVGAQKPQYDIWGDTVNTASRMESHGAEDKIQVPYETAQILIQNGIPCEERGAVDVKGKGTMLTYFIGVENYEDIELPKNTTKTINIEGLIMPGPYIPPRKSSLQYTNMTDALKIANSTLNQKIDIEDEINDSKKVSRRESSKDIGNRVNSSISVKSTDNEEIESLF